MKTNTMIAAALMFFTSISTWGQDYSALYEARLSAQDHRSSRGAKLSNVLSILRQDRANYHKFKKRDAEDQGDPFFSSVKNRGLMEQYFNNVYASDPMNAKDKSAILNGTPLVRVSLVDGVGEKYLSVEVLPERGNADGAATGMVTEPKIGSPERKAIMKAMRGPVSKYAQTEVVFTGSVSVCDDWATLSGSTNPRNGKSFPEELVDELGLDFFAVLQNVSGAWEMRYFGWSGDINTRIEARKKLPMVPEVLVPQF